MEWVQKISSLPIGYSKVNYEGKSYGVSRADFNEGRSIKVYAKDLGGNHFISFNYYCTSTSNLLKPCEMSSEDVIHFLEHYT
ncbi:MAG: peptide methionine sulfoxide reductase [Opitutaceae bacterium]|nr:peptide methionine sulfoxide reductase [Cytophagales bacterium]